jgi:hypothetical protein
MNLMFQRLILARIKEEIKTVTIGNNQQLCLEKLKKSTLNGISEIFDFLTIKRTNG